MKYIDSSRVNNQMQTICAILGNAISRQIVIDITMEVLYKNE